MRARGAQVTDVVILIVAADDGVMPQTIEAINHAKAAGVDIVVAITKVRQVSRCEPRARQAAAGSEHEVYVEGYGGDVSVFEVSRHHRTGRARAARAPGPDGRGGRRDRYRANPKAACAQGTVIEAENSPQRGVLTTVLVQNGTLKQGRRRSSRD